MSSCKTKTATAIAIVLLTATVVLMVDVSVQPVQAQLVGQVNSSSGFQGWHGTTSADRAQWPGIPKLGPLPSGVTPAYTYTSTAYMSITPSLIGVGQTLLVNVWSLPGVYHAFYMQGYTVYVQKPNGDTETIGPYDSFMADSTAWFSYIPDQIGTYRFKFESAGTYVPAGTYVDSPTGQAFLALGNYTLYASVYYTPSETDWQNVTVQQDMVASYPPAALPTDYWSRPINPSNREWWPIAGNYPFTGAYYYPNGRVLYASNYKYTAYVQAPNTCHVVWRRQGNIAGLIGGEEYQYSISAGSGTPSIIFSGRCYQTVTRVIGGQVKTYWECYDLRTGEVYWDIESNVAPSFISYEKSTSEAVPGATASQGYSVYLVSIAGGRLVKWNPYTGAIMLNVSTGLPVYPPSSLGLITTQTVTNGPFVLNLVNYPKPEYPQNWYLINWTVAGSSTNFSTRIMSNITYGQMAPYTQAGQTIYYNMTLDAGIASIGAMDLDAGIAAFNWWAYPPGAQWGIGHFLQVVDLRTGQTLWISTNNDTLTEEARASGSTCVVDRGKVAFANSDRSWTCWDARTGKKLWVSEQTKYPWGVWWPYNEASYDFNETKGAIIAGTYEGVYAIDWDNGKILWHYTDPNVIPFESPYGTVPFYCSFDIADGKIYAYNTEHSPSQPLTRDWKLHCINATTGEGIWRIAGSMAPGAVADGYITASNSFDGYMYVFGKGRSAATVTANDKVVAKGDEVLIEGTVMDMSPGDQGSFQNPTAPLDSPTEPGTVPCVSAASMQTQMEYLYMQHPIDGLYHNETITGVPVKLTAIDSKGSVTDIGTTTTNGYGGTFGISWTPPNEDTYTIFASFNGDDSYGSSTATTSLTVGPAPATPTTPEIPTPVDNTMTIIGTGIAIIIAVVIAVAIVGILLYRKRT
jgi:hypothetical protein